MAAPRCWSRGSSACASSRSIETEPYLRVRGVPLYEDERHDMASEALMRAVLALFEKAVDLNPDLPEDAYVAAMNEHEPGSLADLVGHVLDLDLAQRQELLETLDANLACNASASCWGRSWTSWSWRTASRPRCSKRWTSRSASTICASRCAPSRPSWAKRMTPSARSPGCANGWQPAACPMRRAPRPRRNSTGWPPCPSPRPR